MTTYLSNPRTWCRRELAVWRPATPFSKSGLDAEIMEPGPVQRCDLLPDGMAVAHGTRYTIMATTTASVVRLRASAADGAPALSSSIDTLAKRAVAKAAQDGSSSLTGRKKMLLDQIRPDHKTFAWTL